MPGSFFSANSYFPNQSEAQLAGQVEVQRQNSKPAKKSDTTVDKVLNIINNGTPKFVCSLVPEKYLTISFNTCMVNKMNVNSAYKKLKNENSKNGIIDKNQVREAFSKAYAYLHIQNEEAYSMVDYGCYKEMANSPCITSYLLGPELGYITGKVLGIQDIGFGMGDINEQLGSLMDGVVEGSGEHYAIRSNKTIKNDILEQNKKLDELAQMVETIDYNNEMQVKSFLQKYQEVTGTAFSVDLIIYADALNYDKDVSTQDLVNYRAKAFGLSENYTYALINRTYTDTTFSIERNTVASIMAKIPATKIVSAFVPFGQLAADKLTEGTSRNGDIINTDNITWENLREISAQGAVEGALAQVPIGQSFSKATSYVEKGINKLPLGKVATKLGVGSSIVKTVTVSTTNSALETTNSLLDSDALSFSSFVPYYNLKSTPQDVKKEYSDGNCVQVNNHFLADNSSQVDVPPWAKGFYHYTSYKKN